MKSCNCSLTSAAKPALEFRVHVMGGHLDFNLASHINLPKLCSANLSDREIFHLVVTLVV